MAAPPKYAFITLDQGMSKRDAFLALSQYGDVRLVSKISEVSSIVNDLVRNLEDEMGEAKKVFVSTAPVVAAPVEPRKVRITRRCMPGMGDSPPASIGSILGKRSHKDSVMPTSMFRSAHPQTSLAVPSFSSSNGNGLSPMQQLQQTLFRKDEELIADIKTEEIDDDDYLHDANQPFDSLEEAETAMGMAYDDDDDEPSTSGKFAGDPADLDNFIDDEGNIEVPYAPNFKECKTARHQPKAMEKAEQARCEVCRRWVKCTETLSRLISHVFIHAKKQRFVCPVEGCEYSNKAESATRKHIEKAHVGVGAHPIDSEKDKRSQSEVWKAGRGVWAPRCFPEHFERAPGGNLFMRINEKSVLME